jgi:hypothetical protein
MGIDTKPERLYNNSIDVLTSPSPERHRLSLQSTALNASKSTTMIDRPTTVLDQHSLTVSTIVPIQPVLPPPP